MISAIETKLNFSIVKTVKIPALKPFQTTNEHQNKTNSFKKKHVSMNHAKCAKPSQCHNTDHIKSFIKSLTTYYE